MKHLLFILAILFLCFPAFAQQEVKLTTADGALVRSTNPLPVDAEVNISSITVEAFPVYADETGAVATATVDSSNRVWVNLASDTIGLIAEIEAVETEVASGNVAINDSVQEVKTAIEAVEAAIKPTDIATQTISLAAGVAQEVTSGLTTRRSIYVGSQDGNQDIPIWINLGGEGATGDGLLFFTGVEIPADENYAVWLISSEDVGISVLEQGGL